jgi:hypothetical protein
MAEAKNEILQSNIGDRSQSYTTKEGDTWGGHGTEGMEELTAADFEDETSWLEYQQQYCPHVMTRDDFATEEDWQQYCQENKET